MTALQDLAFFGGLGALILFFSALMIGRLSTFGAREDEVPVDGGDAGARRRRFARRDASTSRLSRHGLSADEQETVSRQEWRGPNSTP